jgi:hypothetical protein
MMMRIESTSIADNEKMTYIINGAQQKAWMQIGDQWIDLTDGFEETWSDWSETWEGYSTDFRDWAGTGDYTYSYEGNTIRYYDIQINPPLDDSLFIRV